MAGAPAGFDVLVFEKAEPDGLSADCRTPVVAIIGDGKPWRPSSTVAAKAAPPPVRLSLHGIDPNVSAKLEPGRNRDAATRIKPRDREASVVVIVRKVLDLDDASQG